ncbi:PIN domain-containing protein [Aeoliella sp.]|uniref:PIN domain-containing protein n=1 Tax=Aeoliella sp. TaxID=2795800 RepID=UPI003CCC04E5
MPSYAFVDTNIFLDFYRSGNGATLKLLERLKPVKDRIICTYQVEMEFLKNRQNVLLESYKKIKNPELPQPPAIFADSATNTSLKSISKEAQKKTKLLKKRIVTLLRQPKSNDVVYQVLEEIFHSESEHVLTRDMDIRHRVKRKAHRRFLLGYPPRKASDTSYGDALNWEWFLTCARELRGKFIIVSRDGDYGITIDDQSYLNDQLFQEFRDRVGQKSIIFTNRLSSALEAMDVAVPSKEVEAESQQLENAIPTQSRLNKALERFLEGQLSTLDPSGFLSSAMEELRRERDSEG